MYNKIAILDFGSQYTQLIARKIRELNVYCEVYPFNKFPVNDNSIKGVILSGSPFSVRQKDAPISDLSRLRGKFLYWVFVMVLNSWLKVQVGKLLLQNTENMEGQN
jgi:hypothetical protein